MAKKSSKIKLRAEEKNKTIIIGVVLVFAALTTLFYFVQKSMSIIAIVGVCFIAQQVYIIPSFCRKYYKLYECEFGTIKSYIPFYNECRILLPKVVLLYCIGSIIAIIGLVLGFIIPYFAQSSIKLFGVNLVLDMFRYGPFICYFGLAIAFLSRGYGYVKIMDAIYNQVSRFSTGRSRSRSKGQSLFLILQTVVLFWPIARSIGIIYGLSNLDKLVTINNYNVSVKRQQDIYEEEDD